MFWRNSGAPSTNAGPPPSPGGGMDPVFKVAVDMIRGAEFAKEQGQLEKSLELYQESLTLLLQLCKGDADGTKRALYLQTAQQNMTEAEAVKQAIAIQKAAAAAAIAAAQAIPPPPVSAPAPAPVAKVARPAATAKPAPTTKETRNRPILPDSHDYTRRAPASSGAGTGAVARKAATPTRPASSSSGKSGRGSGGSTPSTGGAPGAAAAGEESRKHSEFETQILDELMDKSPGVRWSDIAGLSFAKQTLQEAVVLPNLRPDLFTGLRAPPKGVLLFGPPGTGKTLLAKAVATESGFSFFSITASSVTSKYLGEGEKLMRALFDVAREKQPSVIFFDEIDALMSARKDNEHEASRRLKTEFMTQLDGATSSASDRILIMGATNLPWDIDEAILRRLVKRIYVPLPDAESRRSLIRHQLNKQNQELPVSELQQLVEVTEGYSGSDLAALCSEAALGPIREIPPDRLRVIKADAIRPIAVRDFIEALRIIRPSVSQDSLGQFQQWAEQFGVTR